MYQESEYLQISEIQHFVFCPRQWGILHLEKQWQENVRTIEGHALHEKAHDSILNERRKDKIIVRGMPIVSRSLGVAGECDVVEFNLSDAGVYIPLLRGKYMVTPVEYKRGHIKEGDEDISQLMVQALCLEEMLSTEVSYGYLYYDEIRRRQMVSFSKEKRQQVIDTILNIHQCVQRKHMPRVKPRKGCNACSVKNLCVPKLMKNKSAKAYIERNILE